MDFTIKIYKTLLNALKNRGFSFSTFVESLSETSGKSIVLRHDVDKLPLNSLEFAKIQAGLGLKGTYFFRAVPESWDESIIKKIAGMGHEIGYHYEDLGTTAQRHKGVTEEEELVKIAINSFKENLNKLRELVSVKTICMHGSPMSRWDSRLLWKYYDYHDFGLVWEPYFDINFDDVLYLSDTGRRWDGDSYNIRDKFFNRKGSKVSANRKPIHHFHSTFDIIKAAENGQLPDKIMMTFHPQRWSDRPGPWVKELVWQNVKNAAKYFLVKARNQ